MEINVLEDAQALGVAAATEVASSIQHVITNQGKANIILATGASQFEMLKNLVEAEIDWSQVTMFHLDEYIDLPEDHPASFRKYLRERFLDKIHDACTYYLIDGNAEPKAECERVSAIIQQHPIDVAMIGIGENGHLAFNDPPADFETNQPYIVVDLDKACRMQQYGEGWFNSLADVPKQAISMSIQQILKSKKLIVSVPDERKAAAVGKAINAPISNQHPATILREHQDCHLFLDKASASQR
ncbi:MAG: glucosamine-6-phosphate deaminase [Saprospiraceae bacterium]|nr:glucosamine-6-phosphate deaminase [Saprospiraceae bacterium]